MTKTIGNLLLFRENVLHSVSDTLMPNIILQAIRDALEEDDECPDIETHLAKAGGKNIESYGCDGEAVEVFRIGGFWYVEHYNYHECDARIVIRTLADYMTFQANWLAPVAAKIMQKGQWAEWSRTVHHVEHTVETSQSSTLPPEILALVTPSSDKEIVC
jgi:hypothetical protein